MSSFRCEKCGKEIIDSENGYITSCPHYPMGKIPTHKQQKTFRKNKMKTARYIEREKKLTLREKLENEFGEWLCRQELSVPDEKCDLFIDKCMEIINEK